MIRNNVLISDRSSGWVCTKQPCKICTLLTSTVRFSSFLFCFLLFVVRAEIDFDCFFFLFSDEMLDAENRGVAGRVADLERRVLEQGDELVCLKATLAEALRRLNLLEGMRLAHQMPSAPTTPIRNGNTKDLRLRQTSYSATKLVILAFSNKSDTTSMFYVKKT